MLLSLSLSTASLTSLASVAFSPKGGAEQLVLDGINTAEKSIMLAAYSFTSKPVSQALLEAHRRGVTVQIIVDAKSAQSQHSTAMFLSSEGLPLRINGKYAIFHHKFMVIDNKHLQTGSYNYSAAAALKNAENAIILWDMPEVTQKYTDEWQRLWSEAEELMTLPQ